MVRPYGQARMAGELFDGYEHDGFFDEAFEGDGSIRSHYKALLKRLSELSADELGQRASLRDEAFQTAGITFTVYGEQQGVERTFPMDLLPRLIPAEEWQHLEAGLRQRLQALNFFLDDLYVGERACVHDGVIPWWLIATSTGFRREAFGVPVPTGARCLVAGSCPERLRLERRDVGELVAFGHEELVVLEVGLSKVRALLEHQHAKSTARELASHDAAGGAGADNDEVHVVGRGVMHRRRLPNVARHARLHGISRAMTSG